MTDKFDTFRFETRYGSHCTFRPVGDRSMITVGYVQDDPSLSPDQHSSGLTPKQALKLAAALTDWADRQMLLRQAAADRRARKKADDV